MTRDEKIAEARRLLGEGLRYGDAAKRLGVAKTTLYRWLNPGYREHDRLGALARKDAMRVHRCERCGGPRRGYEAEHRFCVPCWKQVEWEEARTRLAELLELRREGLLNYEIAERFGISTQEVATRLTRRNVAYYDLEYVVSSYRPQAAAARWKQAA